MVALSELLGSLTDYFVIELPSDVETRNAYLYAMGLGLVSLCIMFFHGMSFHQGFLIGLHTKIVLAGAIYQKVMHMQVLVNKDNTFYIDTVSQPDYCRSADYRSYC